MRSATLTALLGVALWLSTFAGAEGTVASSAEEAEPLGVGDKVPELMLKSMDGSDYDLRKAISSKKMALIFFRGGW